MTKRLEYILSGTSYTRIHAVIDDPVIKPIIDKLMALPGKMTNHKFGLLYNAFTEAGFGPNLRKIPNIDSIHADSGGLQIITQGLTATDEIKKKIFKNQATYADLGMCFDEIPVTTVGTTSGRNDTSNRFFDKDNLKALATQTGKNIESQIDVFLEEKSNCKPILIAQGNCYETYMEWVDTILAAIPKEKHKYIGGVAMGGAALGTGSLEDIERAFIYSQLQIEKTHLHVLGVGSIKRMLPYVTFMKNGLYEDASVSYDSTTHSSGIELGNYFKNGSMNTFSRSFNKVYHMMYADAMALHNANISPEKYFKLLNSSKTKWVEAGEDLPTFYAVRLSSIIAAVVNFCQYLDNIVANESAFLEFVGSDKSLTPFLSLVDVKSLSDYNRWKASVGRYVKTNRIASQQPASLEGFFS